MDRAAFDTHMMAIALRMAKRGLGTTSPNPSVGAVIADEATGEVIARGWTQPSGRPHAETEALRRAGARARGTTLYVTLEPCAHHGKTPPCADAIIAAGVKRVVVGAGDPDPRTAGQGIARLRAAGIEVTEGVLEDEARWVTLGHILRVTEKRPFIQLKIALGDDGTVPFGHAGRQIIATGPEARGQGHLMRAEADAILVGRKTVIDDDPALTCRLPGLSGRSPVRVVLGTRSDGLTESKLVQSAHDVPVWIFSGPEMSWEVAAELEEAGARVFRSPCIAGRLSLAAVAEALAAEGITRLLVEGGTEIWRSFAKADLVDEAVVFQAALAREIDMLEAHKVSVRHALAHYVPGVLLECVVGRRIGADTMWRWRRSARSVTTSG